MPQTAIDGKDLFEELKADWKNKTQYMSNTAQMATVWPYQQIIGMGRPVLPLILAELERETDHWFWALEAAFKSRGFAECFDGTLESGFEKVALYGSAFMSTHAARQLPDGRWTSKLGKAEDIAHDTPDDVTGGLYGEVG